MTRGLRLAGKVAAVVLLSVVVVAAAAVAYVEATWRRDYVSTPLPAITASADPAVIARGAYVVNAVAHCGLCHGARAPGAPQWSAATGALSGGPPIVNPFGAFHPTNLTPDADTGIGRLTDGQLARAIRSGVLHDGAIAPIMLAGVGPMADEDLVAVVSYLRALEPVQRPVPPDEWALPGRALAPQFAPRTEGAPPYVAPGAASVARGAYLANGPAACVKCHTDTDPLAGFAFAGPLFAGNGFPHPDPTEPAYEIVAPNLTPGGVLRAVGEDAFVARLRAGRAFAGSIMPWESFQQLTNDDVRSLYRYLRTLPAIERDVGPTRRLID